MVLSAYLCYCQGVSNDRLFDEALRLPAEARAALASELISSLDGVSVDPDRESAWAREIQDRLELYEKGELESRPAADVLSKLHDVACGKAR